MRLQRFPLGRGISEALANGRFNAKHLFHYLGKRYSPKFSEPLDQGSPTQSLKSIPSESQIAPL